MPFYTDGKGRRHKVPRGLKDSVGPSYEPRYLREVAKTPAAAKKRLAAIKRNNPGRVAGEVRGRGIYLRLFGR